MADLDSNMDRIRYEDFIECNNTYSYKSPAKINFSLKIGKREDSGLHKIVSLMRTVNLYDKVFYNFKCNEGSKNKFNIKVEPGEVITNSILAEGLEFIENENNFVIKAAKIFFEKIGLQDYGLDIKIIKNIPMKAGLGGGSSNSAGMLESLNKIFNKPFDLEELKHLGLEIGSDVPFFLTNGTAVVSGFGEEIHEIKDEPAPDYFVVLLFPDFGIPTFQAYADFDDFILTNNLNYYNMQYLDFKNLSYENDFETVIFDKYPVLREMKESMVSNGAKISLLSGSGSTVFGAFKTKKSAESYLDKLNSFSFKDRISLSYLASTL